MIRELAQSEAAYRSLTKSWFQHSSTLELFKRIAERGGKSNRYDRSWNDSGNESDQGDR